ncbi:Helicase associated domain protein [Faecalibacterium duncaniae]|uniref:Helicase associated domain protein n=1 Tax=Faecalibacterium duncaniae (strain DSM 17677 / JCM 31915 / A2-165) TaxID=411483 RepID=UPI0029402BF7|nr:Helicase associated domain protein [Faecalibacterium duncaniae]MDV5042552.1 Helicase associated domain protein [Faecalibacterium duncaniae]
MALRLFEHNEKAYHAAVWMMEQYGKAAIVHPTGTGKSYIAFKLIEDNPEKVVIWLSPSEYIFKTQLESLKRNDPDFSLANVHFYTYAKLMCCTEGQLAEIAGLQPSYIILDEFHRAGAECWGESTVALLKLCPEAKLLGLTATNVRYLDNNRDMAEELFDSRVASDMTLGEAIVRGILPAPNYVTTVYQYQKTLAKYQARVDNLRTPGIQDANQKYLDALRRALEQADGLDRVFAHHITNKCGKYIVFCASKEHMDEMVPHVPEWFAKVNAEVAVYEAYSDDPGTDKAFADFKADESDRLKLLFCIDMLNEGVHVEGVSGVILFRPTISPIIYKQQIGRALTAGENSAPLILDVVNNFEGLCSIAGLQGEMQEAVHRLYANGEGDKIVTERFEVVEQVHDCRVLFEQLQASLSSSWEHYFSEASIYYAEHGNLNVPKLYTTPSGLSLGVWLVTQRRVRKGQTQGNLTEQQIARLDSIGMVWGNRDDRQWNEGYQKARRYFDAHGDLNVPVGYVSPDGYNLGNWVKRQRYTRHNPEKSCAVLTEERIARLDTIGCGGKKRTRERSGWSWHKSLRGKAKIWMSQLTINGRRHRFV